MSTGDGRVVSNFIIQALKGETITIFGDGSQTRSFQYVDDLVIALIKLMNTGSEFTGPVNIGNPAEISVSNLAGKIIELTGSRSDISYHPLPENDPLRRRPDISLARKVLEWEATTSLDQGLKKTIEYFRVILENEV